MATVITSIIFVLVLIAGGQFIKAIGQFYRAVVRPFLRTLVVLRLPVLISIICSAIFFVGQTQDILRSYLLDENYWKISSSSLYIFLLGISVWYIGRLLSIEYAEQQDQTQLETIQQTFQLSSGSEVTGNYQQAIQAILKEEKEEEDKSAGEKSTVILSIYLVLIPRVFGALPLLALLIGVAIVYFSSSVSLIVSLVWLGIQLLALFAFYRLTVKRRDPAQKSFGRSDDSLFSPGSENRLANLSYFIFILFSVPIIHATSGWASWGIVAALGLGVLINTLVFIWTRQDEVGEPGSSITITSRIQTTILLPASINLVAFFVLLFWVPSPSAIPSALGSISILALGLLNLTVIGGNVYYWGLTRNLPATVAIVALALIFSYFNLNDNHLIRPLPRVDISSVKSAQFADASPSSLATAKAAFSDWVAQRPDLEQYRSSKTPYPVYLVAAQGGGIYAAYHAAVSLAGLQDIVPSFASHTFAISGVSGGSLGASGFASLVKDYEANGAPASDREHLFRRRSEDLFGQDLLSPLLAMAMFPDILQRFLPFPINDWDRARGLEAAFEQAWARNTELRSQPLQASFHDFWEPSASFPALLLNSTGVSSGDRAIYAPFDVPPLGQQVEQSPVLKLEDSQVRLSTAAGVSARFPIITPAGWLYRHFAGEPYKTRLVDGGYFDNSGLTTVMDLYSEFDSNFLQQLANDNRLEEIEITVLATTSVISQFKPDRVEEGGLNELLSPLRALLNARDVRGSDVVSQAQYRIDSDEQNPFKSHFRKILIKTEGTSIPLGWVLSKESQEEIGNQVLFEQNCAPETYNPNNESIEYRNSCIAESVRLELGLRS